MFAKASLVDHERLASCQRKGELIDAEETLREAFFFDVRPLLREWRKSKGLPEDTITAFRESGYLRNAEKERAERNQGAVSSYA
jgi:L-rhamnose isomerase/sugar isomerase